MYFKYLRKKLILSLLSLIFIMLVFLMACSPGKNIDLSFSETVVKKGFTVTVSWSYEGISKFKIELLKDGSSVETLSNSYTPNAEEEGNKAEYKWEVSADLEEGDSYSLKVSDSSDSSTSDETNKFAISSVWEKIINNNKYNDEANGCIADNENDALYVVGYSVSLTNETKDGMVKKLNSITGEEIWSMTFSGQTEGPDEALAVDVDDTGEYIYVAGYTTYADNGDTAYTILKLNAETGKEIKRIEWNTPYNNSWEEEEASDIKFYEGNLYVTGSVDADENTTGKDWWVNAIDTDLNSIWSVNYNGSASYFPYDNSYGLDVDSDGVYAVGYSYGEGTDASIAKFDISDGELLWSVIPSADNYDSDGDMLKGVKVADNILYTCGYAGYPDDDTREDFDFYVEARNTADGTLIWKEKYNGKDSYTDYAFDLALDTEENTLYVVGATDYDYDPDEEVLIGDADWWIIKIDISDGEQITDSDWENGLIFGNEDDNENDVAKSITMGSDSLFVAGSKGTTDIKSIPNISGTDEDIDAKWWIKELSK